MASRGTCKNSPDSFCYVCGYYISTKQKKYRITPHTKYYIAYNAYFGVPIGDQDKSWAPHVCCGSCKSTLEGWLRGSRKSMPFAVPRIWREPTNHHDNCYFCMVDLKSYEKMKHRGNLQYLDIPSSIAPVPHGPHLPIPKPPSSDTDGSASPVKETTTSSDRDWDYVEESMKPRHFPTQDELDDLIRDLGLTKSKAELLASRLQEWNLLDSSCKVTQYRKRHDTFAQYYTYDDNLCYCSDITGLFSEIGVEHNPAAWRLFIDSSTKSMKAVLLHNGNQFPSIPVGHSTVLKEDYVSVKQLLERIQYKQYEWDLCGDFKMIGLVLGLQGGFTKYPCFLCLWDSRATLQHYNQRDWPVRNEIIPGQKNVVYEPLVDKNKILLPPLHVKLGIVKQYVKALDKSSDVFKHLRSMFPLLSDAKVTAGVFTGPQIRKMLGSEDLEQKMTQVEKTAWQAFRAVVEGFLGNNKNPNYRVLIENLLESFRILGCRMSTILHYLHSHLDFFRANLGSVSEEHGEQFHQDMQNMELQYQGRWETAMMGDYVWGLVRDSPQQHKRAGRSKLHF